jgi:ribosomal protein S18 acetylase RimI-like enzyme
MTEPEIRRATADDADALARLRADFLAEIGHAGSDHAALVEANRRYMARALTSRQFAAWVAVTGDRIVATAGLAFFDRPPSGGNLDGREAYLLNMWTHASRRGRGLARRLLHAALEHARAEDAHRVWLHSTESGRALYDAFGFTPNQSALELRL